MTILPKRAWGFFALLFTLVASFAPAQAQTFPAFTGLVVDEANVLPEATRADLTAKLQRFQQDTKRQFAIATIDDLQGRSIEDYGVGLARAWGVGLKGADNGIVLIVAPNDRKLRIEVGRDLEPLMTDALSGMIIRDQMVPRLKAGNTPGAVEAGTDAIIQQLRLPDDEAKAKVAAAQAAYDRVHRYDNAHVGGIPVGLFIWLVIIAFLVLHGIWQAARANRSRWRTPGQGGGSNWPVWLWAASEVFGAMGDRGRGGGGSSSGGSDGSWGGGGFTGGGGGDFGGGGASGSW